MNSFFASLFLDLQARIKDQVPDIKWIEQDFGQDAYDKWRPKVDFPAVLIDFPTTNYSQISGNYQIGEATIVVRLLLAPFQQSYEAAPIDIKQGALQFFEIENELVCALNGWTPTDNYCQSLVRTRAQSHNRNDIGLRIRELQFTTSFEEYQP